MKNLLSLFRCLLIFTCLFSSTTHSQNLWEKIKTPNSRNILDILSLESGLLLIATTDGVYKLENNEWVKNSFYLPENQSYKKFAVNSENEIYLITDFSMHKTTNLGEKWTKVELVDSIVNISSIFIDKNNVIYLSTAKAKSSLFSSSDGGKTWETIHRNFTGKISDILVDDKTNIFITTNNCIYRLMRQNNDTSWVKICAEIKPRTFNELNILSNGSLIAGADNDVYKSDDNGDSWYSIASNFSRGVVSDIVVDANDNIFFSTKITSTQNEFNGSLVYFFDNSASSWQLLNPFTFMSSVNCISALRNGAFYVGTLTEGVYKFNGYLGNWRNINNGLPRIQISALFIDSESRVFIGSPSGVFVKEKNSHKWQSIVKGIAPKAFFPNNDSKFKYYLYDIKDINQKPNGEIVLATGGNVYILDEQINMWKSQIMPSLPNTLCVTNDSDIFVGTIDAIYRKLDFKEDWENVYNTSAVYFPYTNTYSYIPSRFCFNEDYLIAANSSGILKSFDRGNSWMLTTDYLIFPISISISSNNIIYCADYMEGMHRSSNGGHTWQKVNLGIKRWPNNNLISNSTGQTFVSGEVNGVYGVYVIEDDKDRWNPFNEGLPNSEIISLALDKNDVLYAVNKEHHMFRTTQTTTSIEENEKLVTNFFLSQNYPNPFNPSTKIKFTISSVVDAKFESTTTKVIVYDVLGREVRTLINKKLSPGSYEVEFDGSNLPSGVYLYRLTNENYSATKKMLLMK